MNPLTYHRIEKLTLEIRQRQDEILRLLSEEGADQAVTCVTDVISAVATAFGVRTRDVSSGSQAPNHCRPRHVAVWICFTLWYERQGRRMTKSEIARQFGRTHGVVDHAIRNVEDWRSTEPLFRKQTDELLAFCSNVRNPKQLTLFKAA